MFLYICSFFTKISAWVFLIHMFLYAGFYCKWKHEQGCVQSLVHVTNDLFLPYSCRGFVSGGEEQGETAAFVG